MTVRYYIDTTELASLSNVEAKILYDQVSAEAAPAAATISAPVVWERDSQYAYIELSWGDYNFVNCGKKVQMSSLIFTMRCSAYLSSRSFCRHGINP